MIQTAGQSHWVGDPRRKRHLLWTRVCLAGADILLLSAAGDFELTTAQGLDVTDDGTHAAVEQTEREVLVAEQSSVVASLSREAEDAGTAQALDSVSQTHLKSRPGQRRGWAGRTTFWHCSRGLPAGSWAATTRSWICPKPSW